MALLLLAIGLLLSVLAHAQEPAPPCADLSARELRQAGGAVLVEDDDAFDDYYYVCGVGVDGYDRDLFLFAWNPETRQPVAVLRVLDMDPSPEPSWVRG